MFYEINEYDKLLIEKQLNDIKHMIHESNYGSVFYVFNSKFEKESIIPKLSEEYNVIDAGGKAIIIVKSEHNSEQSLMYFMYVIRSIMFTFTSTFGLIVMVYVFIINSYYPMILYFLIHLPFMIFYMIYSFLVKGFYFKGKI